MCPIRGLLPQVSISRDDSVLFVYKLETLHCCLLGFRIFSFSLHHGSRGYADIRLCVWANDNVINHNKENAKKKKRWDFFWFCFDIFGFVLIFFFCIPAFICKTSLIL